MTDALNVIELREQWDPDRVQLEVEAAASPTRIAWFVAVGLSPAILSVVGASLPLIADPFGAAMGMGLVLGTITAWLIGLGLLWRRLSPDDIALGYSRSHLHLGELALPVDDVVDLRWEGARLRVDDRDGAAHLSPKLRPRDPDRVLRILRSALPTAEQRAEAEAHRAEAHAQLDPLTAGGRG